MPLLVCAEVLFAFSLLGGRGEKGDGSDGPIDTLNLQAVGLAQKTSTLGSLIRKRKCSSGSSTFELAVKVPTRRSANPKSAVKRKADRAHELGRRQHHVGPIEIEI